MEHEHDLADGGLSKSINLDESTVNSMEPTCNGSDFSPRECSDTREEMKSEEIVSSLPSDIFVYRQDVVSCKKYDGLLGVVLEVAGDADSEGSITDESDDSNSESEENEDTESPIGIDGGDVGGDGNADGGDMYDSLPDGHVRIMWTDGSETAENVSDVKVVDRSFLHEDIVASSSDPTGQTGLVVDVDIKVELLASNGGLIKYVSSKDLKHIREPLVGDYVVHGPWVGRVDDVLDNVTVLFDDGAVCKVVKADPMRLKPLSKLVTDDASCQYYPGQRVRAVSSSVFKTSRWLSGLWKANRLEGTVIKVQPASVVVYWIASAYLGIETNSEAVPSEEQDPKNLTLLSCFSYANWQLGDWCHLPSSSFDSIASKSSKEHSEGLRSDMELCEECSLDENLDIYIKSFNGGSDQALIIPEVLPDHQASGAPSPEADETSKSSQVVMASDDDLNNTSWQPSDGSGSFSTSQESDENSAFWSNESLTLTKTSKSGKTNEAVVDPEDVSFGSSSSVSKEPAHDTWPAYRKKLRKFFFKKEKKGRRRDEAFDTAFFVVNTITKVDVAWQDGTKDSGRDSKSLIPINTPSDQEFFPEQYVVEKSADESDESSEAKRVGLVKTVNSKERTVCVRWFKSVSRPEEPREFDGDEVVSAYELEEHPDYDYCYGDLVVRLSPVSVCTDTSDYGSNVEQPERSADLVKAEGDGNRHSDNGAADVTKTDLSADLPSLSWVGNITGLEHGDIEVTWANGMVSKVGPQAIFVVGREDDGDSFDAGSEVSDGGASWETVDENETGTLEVTEKEADLQSPTSNVVESGRHSSIPLEDNNAATSGPLSMPFAALGFVARLATGLFSRGRKQSDIDTDDTVPFEVESMENGDVLNGLDDNGHIKEESDALYDMYVPNAPEVADNHMNVAQKGDAELMRADNLDITMSLKTNANITEVDSSDDSCTFKHFDIADKPLDHFYLNGGQNSGERKWVKKVQQEWVILEKYLPDDIYVRVFEDRMDLVRAVIIGACGTPYQDGLFFFDFLLPPNYPDVPPTAYYHSGGLHVNPNLYVDGKVCLSLLNTWTGKGNEVWDPSSSSILQVLVSLQGLVLNSKPYFNEAGYERQVGTVEGEKNSLPYNENTYLLNLKSIMYLLRRPPMHFEDFVKDHFRRRGWYILKACEAYMGGCMIGSLTNDASRTEKSMEHPCSTGFKLMLAKILPRLIKALTEMGVDCCDFQHLKGVGNAS